jgi:hypothetical protein
VDDRLQRINAVLNAFDTEARQAAEIRADIIATLKRLRAADAVVKADGRDRRTLKRHRIRRRRKGAR